jgi:hypothetical protein
MKSIIIRIGRRGHLRNQLWGQTMKYTRHAKLVHRHLREDRQYICACIVVDVVPLLDHLEPTRQVLDAPAGHDRPHRPRRPIKARRCRPITLGPSHPQ